MTPTRRDLLRAAPFAALASPRASAASPHPDEPPAFPGMVVRMQEPRNLETPPAGLTPAVTPTEQHYVRSHFPVPALDAASYRLVVEGHVETPLSLSLAEVQALATPVTRPVTLECAGNGRVFLVPPTSGLQWGIGAVGTAEWTGVPLAALLDRAKVKAGGVDVVLVGADKGAVAGPPASPGPIAFDRGIPLAKARQDGTLLAWAMNGNPLPPANGFPLRAVVGGWYGMAAVKWLVKVVVTDRPYEGFWQSLDYAYFDRTAVGPSLTPITAMLPKAIIVAPGLNTVVPAGRATTVTGKAWAGDRPVAKVEVSADGGTTWATAKLAGEAKPLAWRDWTFTWTPATPGVARLVARCTDAAGTTQPPTRDPDRRTYLINHLVPTEVLVK